jgi:hypothetical protein
MNMYLVFSAFTSRPISLLATTKASVFLLLIGNGLNCGWFRYRTVLLPHREDNSIRQLCNSRVVTTSTHATKLGQNETVHESGIDNTVRPLHLAVQQTAQAVSMQSVSDRRLVSVTSGRYI